MSMTAKSWAAVAILFTASSATHAQNESTPAFEVASVKPANTTDLRTSIQPDGGRLLASATLKALIGFAYDVEDHDIVGGPSWMTSGAWLIDARTGGATQPPLPELQQMLQSLLADRFKLSVHRQTREESVYELLPVCIPQIVNGADIRVTESRTGTGFAQEAIGKLVRAELDRHIAMQPSVAGLPHFSHPAFADGGN
jgi:hypothetical protein